jgi:hypothetical protein
MPIYVPGKVVLAQGQPVPNDPNFAFNSLLLHGNGTNGSTVITDSSGSPKTVTAVGNAQISTAQSKFGGASIAFDGAGDYCTTPYSPDFNLEAGNWTIELFAYPSSLSGATGLIGAANALSNAGIVIRFFNNNLQFWVNGFGNLIQQSGSTSTAAWHHIALVRNGSTNTLYLNGSSIGSNTQTPVIGSPSSVAIGRTFSSLDSEYFNGYIDDLRITKGVARYTANFTPPTLPFPDF